MATEKWLSGRSILVSGGTQGWRGDRSCRRSPRRRRADHHRPECRRRSATGRRTRDVRNTDTVPAHRPRRRHPGPCLGCGRHRSVRPPRLRRERSRNDLTWLDGRHDTGAVRQPHRGEPQVALLHHGRHHPPPPRATSGRQHCEHHLHRRTRWSALSAPYVAAKSGLAGVTRNAAFAHRWDKIRINGLDIGWTATEAEGKVQQEVAQLRRGLAGRGRRVSAHGPHQPPRGAGGVHDLSAVRSGRRGDRIGDRLGPTGHRRFGLRTWIRCKRDDLSAE